MIDHRLEVPRLAVLLAVLLAALMGNPGGAQAATTSVAISDFAFTPRAVTIDVGDNVAWGYNVDAGTAPHTVTADDGSFDSGNLAPGGSFSRTFTKAGTFGYVCTYHPDLMTGVVTVRSDDPEPTPTSAPSPVETTRSTGRASPSAQPASPVAALPVTGQPSPVPSRSDDAGADAGGVVPLPPVGAPTPTQEQGSDDTQQVAAKAGPDGGSRGVTAAGALLAISLVATGSWAALRARKARGRA